MEGKDPNAGLESLMPGFQTRVFPPDNFGGHINEDAKAGFDVLLLILKNVHFVKLSKRGTDFTIVFFSSRWSKKYIWNV
jgi:hypothetical protein